MGERTSRKVITVKLKLNLEDPADNAVYRFLNALRPMERGRFLRPAILGYIRNMVRELVGLDNGGDILLESPRFREDSPPDNNGFSEVTESNYGLTETADEEGSSHGDTLSRGVKDDSYSSDELNKDGDSLEMKTASGEVGGNDGSIRKSGANVLARSGQIQEV